MATAASVGDPTVHFGAGHSYTRKKQGARRGTFKERRDELEANPPAEDEEVEV